MAESDKKRKPGTQTFRVHYTEKWPCLKSSKIGPHHAFCTVCSTDFSIGHSGMYDCRIHVNGAKHKKFADSVKQTSITSLFKSVSSSKDNLHSEKVLKAEIKMAKFIAKNNLSLAVADELQALIKDIDPDSKISKDIKCGRSKTTVLIKEMSEMTKETLVSRMKSGPFSLSTDGSNDMDKLKLFPLVVRTVSESGVHSELFSLATSEGSSTGEKIFNLIDQEFLKYEIPWEHCIALGCDNASVMTGKNKGVIAFCREKHPNILLSGCTLHLVHIAAEKGAECLPVQFSELLTDIFHYFKKSSVRAHKLSIFQDFCEKEQLKIIKHVETRWLSIGKCLSRLIHNWQPLTEFFSTEIKEKDLSLYAKQKAESILKLLKSRSTKLYCLFLEYTSQVYTSFLTLNQSDAPRVSSLVAQSQKLVRSVLVRFVKPSAFGGNKLVTDVQYKLSSNIKDNKDLMIGQACLSYIKDRANNGLSSSKLEEFYINVKSYFSAVCDYLIKKLPMNDPALSKLSILDPACVQKESPDRVRYFCDLFPALVPSECTVDTLIEEFTELQILDLGQIASNERIDHFWLKINGHEDETGVKSFTNIAKFMLGLLTIPHSSAHCERIFSCQKNKNRPEEQN